MSSSPSLNSETPLRRLVPLLVTQVALGLIVAMAFVGLYVGLQRTPSPHHLPLAVQSGQLADGAAHALGDKVTVTAVSGPERGRQLVKDHSVVAAIVPDVGRPGLTLYTAGADGRSATTAATRMAAGVSSAAHLPITSTEDLVPLVKYDAQGLSGFYLVFGSTLAAFILAQIMISMAAVLALRWRVLTAAVGVIVSAIGTTLLAGTIYGAVPAPFADVVIVLSLLGAAVAFSTIAVATWIGPFGNIVSTLLFTILGNSTSGATISPSLMPTFLAELGSLLPPGAAFRAVVDFGYFSGRDAAGPLLTLAVWVVASVAALLLHPSARRAAAAVSGAPADSGATASAPELVTARG